MGQKMKDLTKRRFGRLVALREVGKNRYGGFMWECQCDCGNVTVVSASNLLNGSTNSCGCLYQNSLLVSTYRKTHCTNTSGHRGVCWRSQVQKWVAYIYHERQQIHLGYYDFFEDAVKAREAAEEKYFPKGEVVLDEIQTSFLSGSCYQ